MIIAVTLIISGEAYFEVFHDSENPFIVHTSSLNIKVLGTIFNVMAHDNKLIEEVVLNTGMIEVLAKDEKKMIVASARSKTNH
jgi:transmembrane sensor